jgi:hypothetical protein
VAETFFGRAIGWSEPTFDGIFGVENNGSVPFFVRSVQVRASGGCTSSLSVGTGTAPGKFRLSRISAVNGERVAVITPTPHSTGNGALPSQVSLVTRPDSVTETGVVRSWTPCDALMNGQAGYAPSARMPSASSSGFPGQSELLAQRYDTDAQPVILREGEGLALLKTEADLPAARRYMVTFTVVATGETFTADFATSTRGAPDGVSWALFNATGSGVVLEVRSVENIDNGEGANSNVTPLQSFPFYRLARGEGCKGGDTVVPISPVSASAPSAMRFVRGPFSHVYMGAKTGVPIDVFSNPGVNGVPVDNQMRLGVLRRMQNNGLGIDLSDPRVGLTPQGFEQIYKAAPEDQGIRVAPGESLAA